MQSGHPAMGAGDSDRQLNSAAAAALDEEHSSMGLFRNEMMLMHTAGVQTNALVEEKGAPASEPWPPCAVCFEPTS